MPPSPPPESFDGTSSLAPQEREAALCAAWASWEEALYDNRHPAPLMLQRAAEEEMGLPESLREEMHRAALKLFQESGGKGGVHYHLWDILARDRNLSPEILQAISDAPSLPVQLLSNLFRHENTPERALAEMETSTGPRGKYWVYAAVEGALYGHGPTPPLSADRLSRLLAAYFTGLEKGEITVTEEGILKAFQSSALTQQHWDWAMEHGRPLKGKARKLLYESLARAPEAWRQSALVSLLTEERRRDGLCNLFPIEDPVIYSNVLETLWTHSGPSFFLVLERHPIPDGAQLPEDLLVDMLTVPESRHRLLAITAVAKLRGQGQEEVGMGAESPAAGRAR